MRKASSWLKTFLSVLLALCNHTGDAQVAAPEVPAYPAFLDRTHARIERDRDEPTSETLSYQLQEFTHPARGVEFHLQYVAEGLGNVSGGYRTGVVYDGLLKLSLKVDPGTALDLKSWDGASLFVNALYPHGTSLSQSRVHDLNGVSNIDAYDAFRLDEFWFEQAFAKALSLRLGLLAADTEFFACNSGSLFVNSCFGALPIISLNFNAPVYPLTAPGVRLAIMPSPSLTLRVGAFNGDVGSQNLTNQHGTRLSFHADAGALILAEGVYQTSGTHPGNYTLGGFYHSGRFEDVQGNGQFHRNDFGLYAVLDQVLYTRASRTARKDAADGPTQALNGFAGAGVTAPEDRNLVSFYLEGGLTYKGLFSSWFPSRHQDVCGMACSYTRISDKVPPAPGAEVNPRHEIVLEASYQVVLSPWLALQPDIQYVINPGATSRSPNALVIGARTTLAF